MLGRTGTLWQDPRMLFANASLARRIELAEGRLAALGRGDDIAPIARSEIDDEVLRLVLLARVRAVPAHRTAGTRR